MGWNGGENLDFVSLPWNGTFTVSRKQILSCKGTTASSGSKFCPAICTVRPQWLEHLWDYETLFETGVVRAVESL